MTFYVITEACIDVKNSACVEVCPVSCIHTTADAPQFYIDPDVCIACEQCALVCPVKAIYLDDELPEDQRRFIEINAEFFQQNKPQIDPISQREALAMIAAAQAFAADNSLRVAVTIADTAGEVVMSASMDGLDAEVAADALKRAYSSAKMGVPSQELRGKIPGRPAYLDSEHEMPADFDPAYFTTDMGGLPLIVGIDSIGAIGVAGEGNGQMHLLCCQAAARAFR